MIQLLEEMQEDIDEEAMILLYNSVLNALVNNNSINKAFLLLRAMMEDQSDADVVEHKLLRVKKAIHPDTTSF